VRGLCLPSLHLSSLLDFTVNYWEKYANIAFNAGQKVLALCLFLFVVSDLLPSLQQAVLTTCVLVNQTVLASQSTQSRKVVPPEALINCCFSFTVRRDGYAMWAPSPCNEPEMDQLTLINLVDRV
jgi:hypothetical protein